MTNTAEPLVRRPNEQERPAGASATKRLTTTAIVDRVLLICALISLPILALVPLHATGYWMNLLTELFILSILATAWNIIGGYTGYAAFGNVAFFGGGAYVAAELMTRSAWSFIPAMLVGGLAMLLYGAIIGLPVLRLRGHYFAIATLGIAIMTRELTNNLAIFGASQPVNLPLKNDPNLFYYVALGLLVIAIAITYIIARSKLGFGLVAIRENEDAALVMGINTTLYKVIAFALNAFLCGLAGGLYAYWHSTIDPPTVFDLTTNVRLIIMAVLGGIGTPLGPVIGAALLTFIQETLWKNFTELHAVLFGAAIVVVVLLMPRGIVYLIRQKFAWRIFVRNLRQYRV
ncbi:MAG: branched-chain amino acid ABC transporter permease [Thermomicrobiales bacterium]